MGLSAGGYIDTFESKYVIIQDLSMQSLASMVHLLYKLACV